MLGLKSLRHHGAPFSRRNENAMEIDCSALGDDPFPEITTLSDMPKRVVGKIPHRSVCGAPTSRSSRKGPI